MNITEGRIWYYGNRTLKQAELFHPTIDGGYFEHFQYILLIWIASLSFLIFLRQDRWTFPIPLIYLFLFFDDALSLHDAVFSEYLIPIFQKTFLINQSILRIKDFAEITYWIIVLFLILLISIPSYRKCSKNGKAFFINNFKFFFGLAFFASFIDIVESNIDRLATLYNLDFIASLKVGSILTLIEELGEISVIALICIWIFSVTINKSLLKR